MFLSALVFFPALQAWADTPCTPGWARISYTVTTPTGGNYILLPDGAADALEQEIVFRMKVECTTVRTRPFVLYRNVYGPSIPGYYHDPSPGRVEIGKFVDSGEYRIKLGQLLSLIGYQNPVEHNLGTIILSAHFSDNAQGDQVSPEIRLFRTCGKDQMRNVTSLLYTKALGRDASESEKNLWVGVAAAKGFKVESLIDGILRSREAALKMISGRYTALTSQFKRNYAIDPNGLETILAGLTMDNGDVETLWSRFFSSDAIYSIITGNPGDYSEDALRTYVQVVMDQLGLSLLDRMTTSRIEELKNTLKATYAPGMSAATTRHQWLLNYLKMNVGTNNPYAYPAANFTLGTNTWRPLTIGLRKAPLYGYYPPIAPIVSPSLVKPEPAVQLYDAVIRQQLVKDMYRRHEYGKNLYEIPSPKDMENFMVRDIYNCPM